MLEVRITDVKVVFYDLSDVYNIVKIQCSYKYWVQNKVLLLF